MTATQVFIQFLRETCTLQEYLFFREIISHDNGNKYFKKRPLFKRDFVEGYLSRNDRSLVEFMSRVFVLAPNLTRKAHLNPRWGWIRANWRSRRGGIRTFGPYVLYYKRSWRFWLYERLNTDSKKPGSPFKKGETYNFKLNDNKYYRIGINGKNNRL